jgi:DNA ligase-associated metallophosphoesterase
LITTWRARRVVFLGDFLIRRARTRRRRSARWRAGGARHAALELVLVRGNHDDRAGDPPPYLGMRVVDEPFELDGFALCHHPRPRRGAYVLAGHLHPCVSLAGRGFDHLRLPCFWLGDDVGVLPAFGAFTGMHPIRAGVGERVFAVADGAVTAMRGPAVAEAGDRRAA